MSYLSSAGIARGAPGYGTTCRKVVFGGVDVPVVPGAAGRAAPMPGGQAQARRAGGHTPSRSWTRDPAVDDDQATTIPLALVRKLAAELAPCSPRWHGRDAGCGPCSAIGRSSITITSFSRTTGCWPGAGSPARVVDLAVGAGDLGGGLGPVSRSVLAAGHPPLVAGQPAGLALQVPRVGDLLPVAGHHEVRHTEVDTDGTSGLPRGSGASVSSVKVTYQRPSGSRETITIAGSSSVTSTSGQDQTNHSGAPVLARRSSPPRRVNARRV